jgi:hypothetical protein
MSVSSLLSPNPYNLFVNDLGVNDLEGINGILNIGTNLADTTRINIGNGPVNPTPVFIDGIPFPGGFVSSIGPISLTPNNDGCIDTGGVFQLCTTSATQGGVFTNGAQQIGGLKTFVNSVQLPSAYGNVVSSPQVMTIDSSGNIGSENSSAILTLGPYGSTPNADGASLVSGVLTLQPASSTQPGGMSTLTQSILGAKTFLNTISVPATSSTSVGVINVGSMQLHDYISSGLESNVFLGQSAGNFTVSQGNNIGIGYESGLSLSSGTSNVIIGPQAALGMSTGSQNILIGQEAASNLVSGVHNTIVGYQSGINYTGSESHNVLFHNTGLVGESNAIHIGTSTQTACQIYGIYGNSPSSPSMVITDINGNLGSQAIPASGVLSLAAIGSTPNADGGSISGTTLTLQPANASFGGSLTTAAQTIAGLKTMNNGILLPTGQSIQGVSSSPILWQGPQGITSDIFVGRNAGSAQTAGSTDNVGIGASALLNHTNSTANTAVGFDSMGLSTTAANCTAVGFGTLTNLLTGTGNIAIGINAGSGYTSSESNNILIGANGLPGDANSIKIGSSLAGLTSCTIQGIYSASPSTPQMVIINSSGLLGSQAIPSSGVLSLAAVGSSPNANGGTISGTVLTLEPASSTQPGLMTAIAQTFAGAKTFNNTISLLDTTSSTVGVINIGSLAIHEFSAGGLTNVFIGQNAGNFTMTSSATVNVCIGANAGSLITSANSNVYVGASSGANNTTGGSNVGIGHTALFRVAGGNNNCAIGDGAGGGLTSGTNCVIIGSSAGSLFTTGNACVIIGSGAGISYTGSESNNILISNTGTVGESNAIHIGVQGSTLSCQIGGINSGNVVSSNTNNHLVQCDSNGVLTALENYNINPMAGNDLGLGVGTITAMTVRGVSTASPWPLQTDLILNGSVCTLRIPQFTITATSGASTNTAITFSIALPAGYRPTNPVSEQILMVSSSVVSNATNYITIAASGVVTINTNVAWSNSFGLVNDLCITFLAV